MESRFCSQTKVLKPLDASAWSNFECYLCLVHFSSVSSSMFPATKKSSLVLFIPAKIIQYYYNGCENIFTRLACVGAFHVQLYHEILLCTIASCLPNGDRFSFRIIDLFVKFR